MRMSEGSEENILSRISQGSSPARFLYEDERCVAVLPNLLPLHHPHRAVSLAPVHFLVIPRHHIARLEDLGEAEEELVGHLVLVAGRVAGQMGLSGGYRLVINNGREGGQSVEQLHIHVMGGRQMNWPPG